VCPGLNAVSWLDSAPRTSIESSRGGPLTPKGREEKFSIINKVFNDCRISNIPEEGDVRHARAP